MKLRLKIQDLLLSKRKIEENKMDEFVETNKKPPALFLSDSEDDN